MYLGPTWILYKLVGNFAMTGLMKTASLGLLEVPVVRVNAGGDAPPDPPSVGDVRGHSPFLVFFKKVFWRISGKIYLAGRPLRYN